MILRLGRLAKRPAVRLIAVIVVLVGVTLGVLVSQQALPGTVTAGPLHDDHGATATGVTLWSTGRIWTAVVEATFDGDSPAHVRKLELLPVPGFPTPTLVQAGYVTNSTFGSIMGRPKGDIRYEPLVHATIRPSDNRLRHTAGIMVILQAGKGPGMYAIEGVEVEYTVGSTRHRSLLYTVATGCVPPVHKSVCPRAVLDKVFDRMIKDSGG